MTLAPLAAIVRCACGEITGVPCAWDTTTEDAVVVEHMPAHLRVSHEAADHAGSFPHNGSVRLALAPTCAEERIAADPGWTTMVD